MKKVPYYKRNVQYYLEKSYLEHKGESLDMIDDYIVEGFINQYISESDKKIINLALRKDVSQEDFDKFITEWDIEEQGGYKSLLLSYFMKQHPDLKYPEYIGPRLSGLLQFHRFRNLRLIGHFKKICTRFKECGITDILIVKGGAMRYYCSDLPRIMGDIDVLLHENDYERCKDIVKELGYTFNEYKHSFDLHEIGSDWGILDVHHKIAMVSKNEEIINDDLFARSKREKVFGVDDILVPSYEDMMFISLINLTRNLMHSTSISSVIYSIFDCMYLTEQPGFDWNIVKQNAVKTQTQNQIHIAIRFLNKFLISKLSEFYRDEFMENSVMYLYNEYFIQNLKKKSHSISLIGIIKSIFEYISFRPQYLILKRRMIRENRERAKFVLEKQRLVKE